MTQHQRTVVCIVVIAIASWGSTLYAQSPKNFFGIHGGGIFYVAGSEAGQREIGINSDAAAQVNGIIEDYRRDMREAQRVVRANRLSPARDLSPEELEKRNRKIAEDRAVLIQKVNEKYVAQLKAAVSSSQFERLQQIAWQVYGSEALATDPNLAKALELNEGQVRKIVTLNSNCAAKVRQLYGRTTFEDAMAKVREFEKERDGKALEVLTKEQQDKLKKLKGKPFDLALLDPREGRRP